MNGRLNLDFYLAVLAIATLLSLCAQGQESPPHAVRGSVLDAVGLTGQMWVANGNYSPVERGNILSQWDFKQSASIFSTWHDSLTVTPYVELGAMFDAKGYSWNNKLMPSAGIKVDKLFRTGVISVGTAYSSENRAGAINASGRTDYISGWFGWQAAADQNNRFPGSTWFIVGHISPVEHGNLIEQGFVTQGYVLHRFNRAAVVSYGEITVGRDSQKLDWDNKFVSGGGMKIVVPVRKVYIDFGAGMAHEDRLNSPLSATAFKIFMNASYTWHVFGRGE